MLKSMEKPPLLELVVDVQFTSDEVDNIILGVIEKFLTSFDYSVKHDIPKTDSEIQALYKFDNVDDKTFSCFVRPQGITLSWSKNIQEDSYYPGWTKKIKDIFEGVLIGFYNLNGFEKHITSLKYRTIDAFEEREIMTKTNLIFSLGGNDLRHEINESAVVFSIMNEVGLKNTINMANAVMFSHIINDGTNFVRSIIDITTEHGMTSSIDSCDNLVKAVNVCHDENKRVFEMLISKEFAVQELGALYE